MCKTYNSNNNKTADIEGFYYYIIIQQLAHLKLFDEIDVL